jgi:hypothetical protein
MKPGKPSSSRRAEQARGCNTFLKFFVLCSPSNNRAYVQLRVSQTCCLPSSMKYLAQSINILDLMPLAGSQNRALRVNWLHVPTGEPQKQPQKRIFRTFQG